MSASTAVAMRLNLALRVAFVSAKIESLLTFQSISRMSAGSSRSMNVPVPARTSNADIAMSAAHAIHLHVEITNPPRGLPERIVSDSSPAHEDKRGDQKHAYRFRNQHTCRHGLPKV